MTRILAWVVTWSLLSGIAIAQTPQPVQPGAGSTVYPGTRQFTAGGHPVAPDAGETSDVTLNFPNADVHEVAKAILGDILGLNYSVDPQVQAQVTVETAQPVARADVLPILEESLAAAKLGLVKKGDVYTIVSLDKAKRQPQLLSASAAGFGSEAVPLRYVNAVELKKLLDPMVPENAIAQADASRNLLLITGTAGERRSIRELIRQFDVNWMRGMSFALLVPVRTDMHVLMPELDAMVNAPGSPTQGLVRLIPIERLNGILAISSQPQYLRDLKKWVSILDREGGENERKLFVYHVQNGRASDLATVLVGAFGGNTSQATKPTTPNLTATGQATPIAGMQQGTGFQQQNQQGGTTGGFGQGGFGSSGGFGSNNFPGSPGYQPGGANTMNNNGDNTPGSTQQAAIVSQTLLLPGQVTPVSITSDDGNNAIVIYATPRQYGIITDALRQLDVLPLQVLIEAAITEVTLNNQLQYGVQWLVNSGSSQFGISQGTTATPTQIFPGFSYLLSSKSITATLNALSDITTVKVLSAPKLLVLNNHTAALQVGDEVPILTAQLTSDLNGVTTTNQVDYKDTGVILTVTPRVNDGGLVLIDVSQEVSDVSDTPTSGIDSPTIHERKIMSSIAVKDGQTVALGGLIRDNNTIDKAGIPWLNQIPVVGNLFGSTNNTDKRTELLVLLTPRVVRNSVDIKTITDELRDQMHALTPLPALQEQNK